MMNKNESISIIDKSNLTEEDKLRLKKNIMVYDEKIRSIRKEDIMKLPLQSSISENRKTLYCEICKNGQEHNIGVTQIGDDSVRIEDTCAWLRIEHWICQECGYDKSLIVRMMTPI